jgi:hypothetical protein
MHVLRHPTEVLAFLEDYPDPCINALILQRMTELIDDDTSMEELVVFVILEAGEGIDQLQNQMGFQVFTDQGSPLWEVVEEHATCFELVFVLSSSGQGVLVFAPKAGCAPDILALCQAYAVRSPPQKTPDAPDAIDAETTAPRGGFFTPI